MKSKLLFVLISLFSIYLSAQKRFCDTIPFRNDLGLIIVPIQFNGQEKNFIFDTGATHSIGYSWVKDELKTTKKTLVITSSSKSKFRLRYYKSDTVQLASAKITKHRILGAKDSEIFSCYEVDGVLGMDIISHFNWLINYKDQYLVMFDSDFFPQGIDHNMYAIDFKYQDKRPLAFFNLLGKEVKFLVDTGATNSDIHIGYKNVIKNLNANTKKEIYSTFFDFNGILNTTKSITIKLPEISSKSLKLSPIVDFSEKSNKIGNSSWQDNSVFMSTKNNKLYCSVNSIDESRESYGCFFIFDNKKMVTAKVIVGSKAWEEGVRRGREVLKINELQFSDFCTIHKFQREIAKQKNKLKVTLDDGKTITLNQELLFK
ncbi:retropepsin-like aspartic protease [Aquimarina sp. 2304DJ70-9]|uniref:retropepsin-like aspartic protease n=1 Tax=Aquimarina penaris TaxID=3231044 RepID=UPI00346219BF